MESILRISDAAAIGFHAMCHLAEADAKHPVSAVTMATELGVSEAHLSKVLQRLGREQLVTSRRGPGGGFTLAKPASDVRLFDIYDAVEGPLPQGECLLGKEECVLGPCIMGSVLNDVHTQVAHYLKHTTLQDLMDRRVPIRCVRPRMAVGAE